MAGNARFHDKLHRKNHHTLPTVGFPDSGTDPIASYEEPFKGDFVINGSLSTTAGLNFLSANIAGDFSCENIHVRNYTVTNFISGEFTETIISDGALSGFGEKTMTMDFTRGIYAKSPIFNITEQLTVSGSLYGNEAHFTKIYVNGDSTIDGNLLITGSLTALGDLTVIETNLIATSAVSIQNNGGITALLVNQVLTGYNTADFQSNGNSILSIQDNAISINTVLSCFNNFYTEYDIYANDVYSNNIHANNIYSDNVTTLTNDLSGIINTFSSNSSNWDSTYSSVCSNSANWDSVYASISGNSSNWDSTYSTVSSISANWDSTYTNVYSNSSNWDSTYSNVYSNSSNWDSTYSNVYSNSSNWDSTYSTVSSISANLVLLDSNGNLNVGTSGSDIIWASNIRKIEASGDNGSVIQLDTTKNPSDGNMLGAITFANYGNGIVDNSSIQIVGYQEGESTTSPGSKLSFFTKQDDGFLEERMQIDSLGCIGIGTNSPDSIGIDYKTLTINGLYGGGISLQLDTITKGLVYVDNNGLEYSTPEGDSHIWSISGIETMRIVSGGNVGIGTSTPSEKLEVSGNANILGNLSSTGNVYSTNISVISTKIDTLYSGFNSLLSSIGYQKLPSGMIMQWGNTTCSDTGETNQIYPIEFSNQFFNIVATPVNGSGSVANYTMVGTCDLSSFNVSVYDISGNRVNQVVFWQAMGY